MAFDTILIQTGFLLFHNNLMTNIPLPVKTAKKQPIQQVSIASAQGEYGYSIGG